MHYFIIGERGTLPFAQPKRSDELLRHATQFMIAKSDTSPSTHNQSARDI